MADQQQEAGVEASRREESFEGNNMIQIDMPPQDMESENVRASPLPRRPEPQCKMFVEDMKMMEELNEIEKPVERSSEIQASGLTERVQQHGHYHDNSKMLKGAYLSNIASGMADQQQKAGVEASRREESFEGNVMFRIGMPTQDMVSGTLPRGPRRKRMAIEDMKMMEECNGNKKPDEKSSEIQTSGLTKRVQPHGFYLDNLKTLKDAYLSIKGDVSAQRNSPWRRDAIGC